MRQSRTRLACRLRRFAATNFRKGEAVDLRGRKVRDGEASSPAREARAFPRASRRHLAWVGRKLLYTWNGAAEAFAVKKEQEFSLKPQEDVKYKLLEVEPGKAIIIDTQKPNDKIEIGPAKQ
jgi:hypothetical protein